MILKPGIYIQNRTGLISFDMIYPRSIFLGIGNLG